MFAAISALTLERQSEVLELLATVDDPSLMDTERGDNDYDIVSLDVVRSVDIDVSQPPGELSGSAHWAPAHAISGCDTRSTTFRGLPSLSEPVASHRHAQSLGSEEEQRARRRARAFF